MDYIIIGGGVSGMVAAINLARNGKKVTILERNNKLGKKLLLTGNSRCNFWNQNINIDCYHASNKELFQEFLTNNQDKVLEFINSIGVISKNINGYYYPFTNQSVTVLNALVTTLNNLNVNIILDCLVEKIEKKDNFIIYTNKGIYQTSKVVLAMGGASYSKTGSDGMGYKILNRFNHKVNKILPSLCKLYGNYNFKDLKGVKCEVNLSLEEDNKLIKEEHGELLFLENGLSGICLFNLSGDVVRGLNQNKKEVIYINFMPFIKKDKVLEFLDKKEKITNYNLRSILEGFLNYKLVNLIYKKLKLNDNIKWKNASKDKIIKELTSFEFIPTSSSNLDEAQVVTGGLVLDEVNLKTMESKKVPGLYIIGELLDVDGICGGYNLGFAIMSALEVR